ncbi:hypothetical protein K4K59_007571 [Colletotrichum sp. SAR11_240]|nr:hypothetical protein K4K59_007571 [Colletotrichum sp. SAR11_240]
MSVLVTRNRSSLMPRHFGIISIGRMVPVSRFWKLNSEFSAAAHAEMLSKELRYTSHIVAASARQSSFESWMMQSESIQMNLMPNPNMTSSASL